MYYANRPTDPVKYQEAIDNNGPQVTIAQWDQGTGATYDHAAWAREFSVSWDFSRRATAHAYLSVQPGPSNSDFHSENEQS